MLIMIIAETTTSSNTGNIVSTVNIITTDNHNQSEDTTSGTVGSVVSPSLTQALKMSAVMGISIALGVVITIKH